MAVDPHSVVYGPPGDGQMTTEIPRIQLPDESSDSAGNAPSDCANLQSDKRVRRRGHFVSEDGAVDGNVQNHTTAE